MAHIPKQQDRYKVWSDILTKHEKRWKEKGEYNLDALYSNHCQVVRELRKGRITVEEFEDLAWRYTNLKEEILEQRSLDFCAK